ncbi:unnamed protein product [Rangifer tarandus platyrhynchus]|uniref:Uncharacterized protein n=1 Tax=Rangifer tarandus platyrhynchus TaxID=3082113 RepID=A0ABN9A8J2_RANTA|nr:unnamed protein product [Rangifer tarandus platyrhynchus]
MSQAGPLPPAPSVLSQQPGSGAGRAREAEAARYSCHCFDLILRAEQVHPPCPLASCPRPSPVPAEPSLSTPRRSEPSPRTSRTALVRPHLCIWAVGDPAPPGSQSIRSSALPGDGARPLRPQARRCGLPKQGRGGGFGQRAGSLGSRRNRTLHLPENSKLGALRC